MSQYEAYISYKSRLNERNAIGKMKIYKNKPPEFRAEKLLIVAMDKYWKKETKSG